jgi:hypothetical protein
MAEQRGPVIRLQDGPGAGWQFHQDDFLERIHAAQRIRRAGRLRLGTRLRTTDLRGRLDLARDQLPPRPARVAAPGRITVQPAPDRDRLVDGCASAEGPSEYRCVRQLPEVRHGRIHAGDQHRVRRTA